MNHRLSPRCRKLEWLIYLQAVARIKNRLIKQETLLTLFITLNTFPPHQMLYIAVWTA